MGEAGGMVQDGLWLAVVGGGVNTCGGHTDYLPFPVLSGSLPPGPQSGSAPALGQARIFFATSPYTSVRRKSRPLWL